MSLSNPEAPRSEALVRALLIGFLCALPAILCLQAAGISIADPDVGWHLRTGEWILQHHAWPRVDPFSWVRGGSPWQAYSWLFDLILLKFWSWRGLQGLVIFTAAMMALIAAATYHMLTRLQEDFTQRILLTTMVVVCLSRISTPRPWLFSILFFVFEMDILMRARRSGKSRELLWLPLLFALWANVHIQFIDGLIPLALAAVEPAVRRWWKSEGVSLSVRPLVVTLIASGAAACVNPYGPGIYKIAWQLGSQSGVLDRVSEMMALPFRAWSDYLLLFMALAAAGVLFRYRRLVPFETLMLAIAAVLSFRSRRDLWILAITACAVLAGVPARAERKDRGSTAPWAVALSAASTLLFFAGALSWSNVTNPRLEGKLAGKMPVRAVNFIRDRHYSGTIFNPYDWGGYLIWNLREPVSIDGRAALYGDAAIDRSWKTWAGGADWAKDPDLMSAGVVIAPKDAALTQLLRLDPHFVPAYEDNVATVFISECEQSRLSGQHAANRPPDDVTPVTMLAQRAVR